MNPKYSKFSYVIVRLVKAKEKLERQQEKSSRNGRVCAVGGRLLGGGGGGVA